VAERRSGAPGARACRLAAIENHNNLPGNAGVDQGFLYGAVVYCFTEHLVLPSAADVEVLRFHFDVSAGAPEGTTMVRFLDGALQGGNPNYPVENLVTVGDEKELRNVPPELASSFLLVDCEVLVQKVVIDLAIFRRGDVDGSGRINVTDSVRTFNYLFFGGEEPACLDAADADDDGQVLLTDGVYLLNHLFLSGPEPPPPYPDPGRDPTPDAFACPER
jgi:hypothetical protein